MQPRALFRTRRRLQKVQQQVHERALVALRRVERLDDGAVLDHRDAIGELEDLAFKTLEPEHFREFRLRVITDRLEAMPELIDRLYKRLGD